MNETIEKTSFEDVAILTEEIKRLKKLERVELAEQYVDRQSAAEVRELAIFFIQEHEEIAPTDELITGLASEVLE
jgi:hypothetical protein